MGNFAVFIDLNAMNLDAETVQKTVAEAADGDATVFSKFYNFNNKRHREFLNFIKLHGSEIAAPIERRKRVRADVRLIIDSVRIAAAGVADKILIVAGELDLLPLITALKAMNIVVIVAAEFETKINAQATTRIIIKRPIPPSPARAALPNSGAKIDGHEQDLSENSENFGECVKNPNACGDAENNFGIGLAARSGVVHENEDLRADSQMGTTAQSFEAFAEFDKGALQVDANVERRLPECDTFVAHPYVPGRRGARGLSSFVDENGEIVDERLRAAILKSGLSDPEKLLQETTLFKIKAALQKLLRQTVGSIK